MLDRVGYARGVVVDDELGAVGGDERHGRVGAHRCHFFDAICLSRSRFLSLTFSFTLLRHARSAVDSGGEHAAACPKEAAKERPERECSETEK